MNKIAVLIAVPDEAPDMINLPNVFVTGLGKINAAISATEIIIQHRPDLIVNFGSAGGVDVDSGLHRIAKIVQRDINCSALGFDSGCTPFDLHPATIDLGCNGIVCGTGDNFVAGQPVEIPCNVVDMEAYAIAHACRRFSVPFACWKWVSDSADAAAADDWNANLSNGQEHFLKIYNSL